MHKMKCDINSQFVMLVVVLVTQIAEMKFSVSSIKAMFLIELIQAIFMA